MRTLLPLAAAAALLAAPSAQAQPLGGEQPMLREIAAEVSAARERAIDEKLVGFGTRHAGSDTKSATRGIGAARRWIASEFTSILKDCGGRL